MDKSNREQSIIDILDKKGFSSVTELANLLYASPSSIRRDLTHLEEKKTILRTHGGAILAKDKKAMPPFYARRLINSEQKEKAAEKAAFLLRDSMSVMIDGSSTALQILPHLKKHTGIKVFTNSIHTFQNALEMGLEAYCFGGSPSVDKETLCGSITEDAVGKLYTDILFFSSKCINENGDISDSVERENQLRKLMLKHAKIRVFLYDSSKMGTTALYGLCNVCEIDYTFSDIDGQ